MNLNVGAEIGRVVLYIVIPLILLVFVGQYNWAKTCEKKTMVLVADRTGAGRFVLADKEGGVVNVRNPMTDETRSWPVNELATIGVPYPGLGFFPKFLQKEIRLTVVNEGDWEPVLNRSPHRMNIASPNVVEFLREIANNAQENGNTSLVDAIDVFLSDVATGPTRELIGDPLMLGSLMRSNVMKALASVGEELMEALKRVTGQLARVAGLNPTYVYIGLGLVLILSAFMLYKVMQTPDTSHIMEQLNAISNALGVPIVPTTGAP